MQARLEEITRQQQLNPADAEGLREARGDTVPTNGDAGYAKGCIFPNTAGTDHTDTLYCNIGTVTSCNFNAMTIAADA